jgi:transcriptional regulator with XRE-family HTH domain
MASDLGRKIKSLRQSKRMTLDRLAEIARSSKSYIWALENREVPPQPSAEKIFAIAAALSVTPEFLLSDEQAEPGDEVVEAFFRKYKRMPADAKHRLRQILDAWDKDP